MVLNPTSVPLFLLMDKFFPHPGTASHACTLRASPWRSAGTPSISHRNPAGPCSGDIYMYDASHAVTRPPPPLPRTPVVMVRPCRAPSDRKGRAPAPLGHFITTKLVDNRHVRQVTLAGTLPGTTCRRPLHAQWRAAVNRLKLRSINNGTQAARWHGRTTHQPPSSDTGAYRLPPQRHIARHSNTGTAAHATAPPIPRRPCAARGAPGPRQNQRADAFLPFAA